MNDSNPDPLSRLSHLLLPVVTVIFLIAVQAWHFHARPYRQDEAWVVHYALQNIERVGLVGHALQIFQQLAPENVLQDIWVHSFGHIENIVRYFSTLVTVITLALCYRLAADLFDRKSGWLAMVLLGSYSVFVYYSHEARPYAGLALGAVGFQWALLRFIRRPEGGRASLVLLFGVVPFYLHPFMLYVFIAQLTCTVVFVRLDRDLFRRGIALFVVLALLIALRAWVNFDNRDGVITYNIESTWDGVEELYDHYRANPEILGLLFFIGGVTTFLSKLADRFTGHMSRRGQTAFDRRMRLADGWREGWLVLSLIVMVGAALLVNASVPSLTPRNLFIATPTLVLIAVVALRQMPRQAQLLALLFFCLPFVTQFRSHNGNAGYWELADYIEGNYQRDRDGLVVVAAQAWEWIAINYFLQERTDIGFVDGDIFYVSWEIQDKDSFGPAAIDEQWYVHGFANDDWQQLQRYLGDRERLWVITGNPFRGGQNMLNAIDDEYTLYSAVNFPGETYYRALEVLQYRRHPAAADPLWRYGEDINLLQWRLNDAHQVRPCQTISVDTWWSSARELDQLYSSTLVIADENGQGVANADHVPGGIYPTSIWQPHRPYFDERHLTIPCDLAAGEYPLLLGFYALAEADDAPVEKLPVYTSSGEPSGRSYEYLTTLSVQG